MYLKRVKDPESVLEVDGQDIEGELESIITTISMSLPDFILQMWKKIGRRLGSNTMSRTANGALG